jgi:hypothetical protein
MTRLRLGDSEFGDGRWPRKRLHLTRWARGKGAQPHAVGNIATFLLRSGATENRPTSNIQRPTLNTGRMPVPPWGPAEAGTPNAELRYRASRQPQTPDSRPRIEDENEDEEEGKTSNIEHRTSNFQFEDKSSGGAPKGTGETPVPPWGPAEAGTPNANGASPPFVSLVCFVVKVWVSQSSPLRHPCSSVVKIGAAQRSAPRICRLPTGFGFCSNPPMLNQQMLNRPVSFSPSP